MKFTDTSAYVLSRAADILAFQTTHIKTRAALRRVASSLRQVRKVEKGDRSVVHTVAEFVAASLEARSNYEKLRDFVLPARRREIKAGRTAIKEVFSDK